MPKVTYVHPDGARETLEIPLGTSIMRAAIINGVDGIVAECGGEMMCATCHVYVEPDQLDRATFQFVRHDQHNRTVMRALSDESEAYDDILQRSLALGASLSRRGDEVEVELRT